MNLFKLCSRTLVFYVLLLAQVSYAERGITSDNAGPHFSSLKNQETIEDIRLKVLGGYVRINRVWNGQNWAWNERWGQLEFMSHSTTDALGEVTTSIVAVYRAGQLYRKTSETSDEIIYENQLNQFITKNTTGYIWNDRKGNGITYDLDGRLINYFDKNNVYVYVDRDSDGVIQTIKDHHQNIVLTYTYESYVDPDAASQQLQRIKSFTDYKGRTVIYGWNNKNQLETVTDVRGQVWTYVYSDKGLLTQLKDPDNRITRYEIEKGGKFISRFNADGVGDRYKYNYDKEKQIYYMSKTNGEGHVEETWNNAMGMSVRHSANGEDKSAVEYILSDSSKGVENIIKNYSHRVEYWYRGSELLYKARPCNTGETPDNSSSPCFLNDPRLINKPIYIKYKKVTDAKGDITAYEYDQWKNEIGVTYPDGSRTSRKMHATWSLPLSETNENGVVTEYQYDEKGNLITLIEAKGTSDERVTRYTYDEYGQLETRTTGESAASNTELAITIYEYDQYGNITKITDPETNVIQYSDYDALGNAQIKIDARANLLPIANQYIWKSEYDAAGNLLAQLNPYGKGESYTYTKTGDLKTITSVSGSLITLTSNANGHPLTITDSSNNISKIEYDKAGRLTFTTDANGNRNQIVYDAKGNIRRIVDGENNATSFDYKNDLLHSIQYPSFKEILDYDKRNQIKQTTQQANSRNYIRKKGYDKAGNLEADVDAQENSSLYGYDALNRVNAITDAEGGVTEFAYDARDNLLQVKDPEGRLTIYTYDKNDRLLTETKDGDQNTEKQRRYEYDQADNLITTINPEQEKTTYEFDLANRLIKTRVFAHKDHAHPIKVINYHFNEKSQFTGWTQAASGALPEGVVPTADVILLSETYTYNLLEQLESVVVSFGGFTKSYRYSYYPNGLKKTYINPEGITYTYYYNKNNQLMAVHIPGSGQLSWANFDWLVPQTLLLPGGQKISMRYDDFQQLKERVLNKADDTELAKAIYEYDLEHNIKSIQKGEGVFNYDYDNLYRLTLADYPENYSENAEGFDYDGVGNRLIRSINGENESHTYNQKNQLETISSADDTQSITYTYNANGHTQTKIESGVVTEYIYNHEERLISVKRDGVTLANYAYNPDGQRVKKTVNGETTWYLYNENGLAAEYSSGGQLHKEYHFHPQKIWMTDPLFQRTSSGDVYYYHNDHLGTPQQMVDALGNMVWSAQYSAFGKAHVVVDTVENNLRFPGQYFDAETGLHQNYFRDYDAELGRYIQEDPIGLGGGLNHYGYAYQSPLYYFDPTGELAIGGALAGAICSAVTGGSPCDILFSAISGFFGFIGGAVIDQMAAQVCKNDDDCSTTAQTVFSQALVTSNTKLGYETYAPEARRHQNESYYWRYAKSTPVNLRIQFAKSRQRQANKAAQKARGLGCFGGFITKYFTGKLLSDK